MMEIYTNAFPKSKKEDIKREIADLVERKGKPLSACLQYINGEGQMFFGFRYRPQREIEKFFCERAGLETLSREVCFFGGIENSIRTIASIEAAQMLLADGKPDIQALNDACIFASMPAVLLELREILDECGFEDVPLVSSWEKQFETAVKDLVPKYEELRENNRIAEGDM